MDHTSWNMERVFKERVANRQVVIVLPRRLSLAMLHAVRRRRERNAVLMNGHSRNS